MSLTNGDGPVPPPPPAYPPFVPSASPTRRITGRRRAVLISLAAVLIITVVAVLLTRDGTHHWSRSVEDTFLANCTAAAGGYADVCTCAMHRLEQQFSEQDLAALEGEMSSTGQIPERLQRPMQTAVAACR